MSIRYFQSVDLTDFLHQVIEVVSNYKNKSVKGFIWTSKKPQLNLDGRHGTKKNIYRIVFSLLRVSFWGSLRSVVAVGWYKGDGERKKYHSLFDLRNMKWRKLSLQPFWKKKLSQPLYIYFSVEQIQILINFQNPSLSTRKTLRFMKIEYGVHVVALPVSLLLVREKWTLFLNLT